MTNNKKKARSLILAALMVFSVFAGTVAFTGTAAAANSADIRKATHYETSGGDTVIELAFQENIDNGAIDTVTIVREENDDVTVDSADLTYNNKQVVVPTSDLFNDVSSVEVSFSNGDTAEADVTTAPVTLDTTGTNTVDAYNGSNIALEGSVGDTFSIEGPTGEDVSPSVDVNRGTGEGSQVYVLNTDDFETGTYEVTNGETTSEIDLANLGLSVDAPDVPANKNVKATITADDINRDVEVALMDGNKEVASQTVDIGAEGSTTVDFGTQDKGNYDVVVTDVATGVEASDSVSVTDEVPSEVSLADSTTEVVQGDIANITVEFSGGADEATLLIGDEEEFGYEAVVQVTDDDGDGVTHVQFNSYEAGSNSNVVDAESGSASLQSGETDLGEKLIEKGSYDLTVVEGLKSDKSGVEDASSKDLGTLYVNERGDMSAQIWTAPSTSGSPVEDATQQSSIAAGDWVVIELSGEGLEGMVDGDLQTAFGNGLSLQLAQTEESTKQNQDAKTLDVAPSSDDVQVASEDGSHYVAFKAGSNGATFGTDDEQVLPGEEYNATFSFDSNSKYVADGEDPEEVSTNFEVVEGEVSIDEPVNVTASEGQQITGSSTYAPGYEFQVQIESTGDTQPRFFESATAVVQEDGSWNVTFDRFAQQSAGDTFEVNADGETADGNVVEQTETTTTNTTTSETPTATPTDGTPTASPTDGDNGTPTPSEEPTDTDTPGFGVAVALVALLAAALLAVRRD